MWLRCRIIEQKYWWVDGFGEKNARIGGFTPHLTVGLSFLFSDVHNKNAKGQSIMIKIILLCH